MRSLLLILFHRQLSSVYHIILPVHFYQMNGQKTPSLVPTLSLLLCIQYKSRLLFTRRTTGERELAKNWKRFFCVFIGEMLVKLFRFSAAPSRIPLAFGQKLGEYISLVTWPILSWKTWLRDFFFCFFFPLKIHVTSDDVIDLWFPFDSEGFLSYLFY